MLLFAASTSINALASQFHQRYLFYQFSNVPAIGGQGPVCKQAGKTRSGLDLAMRPGRHDLGSVVAQTRCRSKPT